MTADVSPGTWSTQRLKDDVYLTSSERIGTPVAVLRQSPPGTKFNDPDRIGPDEQERNARALKAVPDMLVLLHTVSATCGLLTPPGPLNIRLMREQANRILASIYEGAGL